MCHDHSVVHSAASVAEDGNSCLSGSVLHHRGRWYLAAGLRYYQSLDTIRAFPDKADGIQRKGIQFTTIRTVEIEEVLFGDFCDHEMVVF